MVNETSEQQSETCDKLFYTYLKEVELKYQLSEGLERKRLFRGIEHLLNRVPQNGYYELVDTEILKSVQEGFDCEKARSIRKRESLSEQDLASFLGYHCRITIWRYEHGLTPPSERYVSWLLSKGYEVLK